MSEPQISEAGKIILDDPATLLARKPKKSILKMTHVCFSPFRVIIRLGRVSRTRGTCSFRRDEYSSYLSPRRQRLRHNEGYSQFFVSYDHRSRSRRLLITTRMWRVSRTRDLPKCAVVVSLQDLRLIPKRFVSFLLNGTYPQLAYGLMHPDDKQLKCESGDEEDLTDEQRGKLFL